MAESEVKSAALWLGKLLVEHINNLDGVRDQVADLQTELNTLAAFLIEAVKTRHQDQLVQTVLSDARNVAYDSQDVIDAYILKVARHGYEEYEGYQLGTAMRWAFLAVNAVPILKLHSKIGELNKRISALKNRMIGYGISDRIIPADNNSGRHLTEPLRRVYAHEREECVVVGFEKQLDELVERLLNPSKETVIAICGMGGIGKSTLARELYHHPKLRDGGYFHAFGWAAASQQLQPDRVLQTLMYSLVPENDHERRRKIDDDIKADEAHAALYNLMKCERCLVVIDDIWTSNDWTKLQAAFPRKKASGSRILVTTRNKDTVSRLDPTEVCLHSVEALDETKSWELFEKTAFPRASLCTDSKKEELGREMLQHCKGVPLAIVVLAKVLQRKQRVEEWIQLRNDISSQIRRGRAPGLYKEVYDVLQVSYDELPYHLKNCFLHLANFPEDYEVLTWKLYQLWIAEGIVSKDDPYELEEDIAERYLNELVSRSMVQAVSWVMGTERIQTCRLHDLMRDVCIDASKREGFVQIVNCSGFMLLNNNSNAAHPLISLPEIKKRLRRIAVYVSDQEPQSSFLPTLMSAKVSRAPNLRSLLFFLSNCEQQGKKKCRKLVENISNDFPLLRVLDCENLRVTGMLPKKVSNLIHLKYLGLANTRVTKLPSSIETLQWLQTLDIRVQYGVVLSLPNVFWKMKQLRHVYLPLSDLIFDVEQGYIVKGGGLLCLDGLCNLQTLMNIDLDRLEVEGLKLLGRLKMVSATCGTKKEALDHLLQGSSSMKSFKLRLDAQILNQNPTILSICEAMCYLVIHAERDGDYRLRQPLSLEMLPQTLVSLAIWFVKIVNDPLPVLERLPRLAELKLNLCYDGQRMVCSASGFPELIHLSFNELGSFRDWEVEQGALLKLKRLYIFFCPALERLPDALPSSVNVSR